MLVLKMAVFVVVYVALASMIAQTFRDVALVFVGGAGNRWSIVRLATTLGGVAALMAGTVWLFPSALQGFLHGEAAYYGRQLLLCAMVPWAAALIAVLAMQQIILAAEGAMATGRLVSSPIPLVLVALSPVVIMGMQYERPRLSSQGATVLAYESHMRERYVQVRLDDGRVFGMPWSWGPDPELKPGDRVGAEISAACFPVLTHITAPITEPRTREKRTVTLPQEP